MSLEELLRGRVIRRIRPDHALAVTSLKRAFRDLDTAKTLIKEGQFDWSLAISYSAMLQAGRALMFERGYRPSISGGHVAVVRFVQTALSRQGGHNVMILDGMRKKRHRVVYEAMDIVSQAEADQALKWAKGFVTKIGTMVHRRACNGSRLASRQ